MKGTIHIVELLTFFDLERTKFTERVFGIFDEDGSGCIDFREFVVSLWNYCTLTNATLGNTFYFILLFLLICCCCFFFFINCLNFSSFCF